MSAHRKFKTRFGVTNRRTSTNIEFKLPNSHIAFDPRRVFDISIYATMNHSHSRGPATSDSSMDNSNVEAKHDEIVTRDTAAELDSGIRAWTVVAGAWCCLFVGFGWVNGE